MSKHYVMSYVVTSYKNMSETVHFKSEPGKYVITVPKKFNNLFGNFLFINLVKRA